MPWAAGCSAAGGRWVGLWPRRHQGARSSEGGGAAEVPRRTGSAAGSSQRGRGRRGGPRSGRLTGQCPAPGGGGAGVGPRTELRTLLCRGVPRRGPLPSRPTLQGTPPRCLCEEGLQAKPLLSAHGKGPEGLTPAFPGRRWPDLGALRGGSYVLPTLRGVGVGLLPCCPVPHSRRPTSGPFQFLATVGVGPGTPLAVTQAHSQNGGWPVGRGAPWSAASRLLPGPQTPRSGSQ